MEYNLSIGNGRQENSLFLGFQGEISPLVELPGKGVSSPEEVTI
jgi:hypothetical protein